MDSEWIDEMWIKTDLGELALGEVSIAKQTKTERTVN
jgi:hypothetical protein